MGYIKAKITFGFKATSEDTDDVTVSTADYEIGNFAQDSAAITNLKTKIANVNSHKGNWTSTIMDEDGNFFNGIVAAEYTYTDEQEINLG